LPSARAPASAEMSRGTEMSETAKVERRIRISADHVDRLNRLAQAHEITEDRIVEKALDILFSVT